MVTIPIWLLIVAMVGACSAGLLAASLLAASRTERWQKIVDDVRDNLRNDRDATREELNAVADRAETAYRRLKECEAVIDDIHCRLHTFDATCN